MTFRNIRRVNKRVEVVVVVVLLLRLLLLLRMVRRKAINESTTIGGGGTYYFYLLVGSIVGKTKYIIKSKTIPSLLAPSVVDDYTKHYSQEKSYHDVDDIISYYPMWNLPCIYKQTQR